MSAAALRPHQPGQSAFRAILPEQIEWRPFPAFAACLLFGFSSGLAQRLQNEAGISSNLLQTLPYILTLIALVGVVGRSRGPAAAGRPYIKQ